MAILVFWVLLALVVAIAAESRGRFGFGWFLLAVLLSPLIGLILILVLPNLRHERLMAETHDKVHGNARSAPFELDGVYAEVPYRVLGDGSVEALMKSGVVRFRSADHLFQTLGDSSAIETAPTQTPRAVPDRQGKMPPALWKVLIVVGLVVGVILYSLKLVDDRSRQVSEFFTERTTIAAETTDKSQAADDAKALGTAVELNKKWEGTFDKTGKYPEGQNANTHNSVYGSVVRISADSPSYRQSRLLVDKFAVRQIKINAVERAKLLPESENPKINLGTLDSSYNSLKGSFSIVNPNVFAIADVQIACSVTASSGTAISDYKFTIFDVVPAKGSKTIKAYDFGYWPPQGKSLACRSTGYAHR